MTPAVDQSMPTPVPSYSAKTTAVCPDATCGRREARTLTVRELSTPLIAKLKKSLPK